MLVTAVQNQLWGLYWGLMYIYKHLTIDLTKKHSLRGLGLSTFLWERLMRLPVSISPHSTYYRNPEGSTNQGYSSGFCFRISWILMERPRFLLSILEALTAKESMNKQRNCLTLHVIFWNCSYSQKYNWNVWEMHRLWNMI